MFGGTMVVQFFFRTGSRGVGTGGAEAAPEEEGLVQQPQFRARAGEGAGGRRPLRDFSCQRGISVKFIFTVGLQLAQTELA